MGGGGSLRVTRSLTRRHNNLAGFNNSRQSRLIKVGQRETAALTREGGKDGGILVLSVPAY